MVPELSFSTVRPATPGSNNIIAAPSPLRWSMREASRRSTSRWPRWLEHVAEQAWAAAHETGKTDSSTHAPMEDAHDHDFWASVKLMLTYLSEGAQLD